MKLNKCEQETIKVFPEHVCPVCNKLFCLQSVELYVYKLKIDYKKTIYFCSYKCLQTARKQRLYKEIGTSKNDSSRRTKKIKKYSTFGKNG